MLKSANEGESAKGMHNCSCIQMFGVIYNIYNIVDVHKRIVFTQKRLSKSCQYLTRGLCKKTYNQLLTNNANQVRLFILYITLIKK